MQLSSSSKKQHTLLAVVFSLASILVFLGRSIYLVITAILPRTIEVEAMRGAVLEIATMVTCALLMVPMFVLNLRALRGGESRRLAIPPLRLKYVFALVVLWVVTLCLGSVVALIPEYGWVGTVPLLPFGILLPLALLVWAGAGGLLSTSPRRFWSVLGFGIAGSTGLAMIGESLALGIARGLGELLWGKQPFWRALMDTLGQQIEAASTIEEALDLLTPYLSNPWIFLALILFAALLVPLIEEAAKASLILYLGPRLRSTGEGFALGALCGAGFSLMEGMVAASAMPLWGMGMIGRSASSAMHITVSALLGGAIASAFLHRRSRQWLRMYLLSSGLHGLWNGALVVGLYAALHILTLSSQENSSPSAALQIMAYSTLILLVFGFLFALFVAGVIALPLCNGRLRKQTQAENACLVAGKTILPAETSLQKGPSNGSDSQIR